MRHLSHLVLLGAVFADHEEILDFLANNRELRLTDGLQPAGEVVVAENFNFLIFLVLREHRVDEENRRKQSLRLRYDGFHIAVSHVEGLELRHDAEMRVFDRRLSIPLLLCFKLIASA